MVPDLCESWNSLWAKILQLELIKLTTEQAGRQRNGSHGQIEEFIRKLSTAFRSHDKKEKKKNSYTGLYRGHTVKDCIKWGCEQICFL